MRQEIDEKIITLDQVDEINTEIVFYETNFLKRFENINITYTVRQSRRHKLQTNQGTCQFSLGIHNL